MVDDRTPRVDDDVQVQTRDLQGPVTGEKVPGWNMPLNHYDILHYDFNGKDCDVCGAKPPLRTIHDAAKRWQIQAMTITEQRIIQIISEITDKPRWHEKVFDPVVVARWKEEARSTLLEQNRQCEEDLPAPLDMDRGTRQQLPPPLSGDPADAETGGSDSEEGQAETLEELEEVLEEETDALTESIHERNATMPPPVTDATLQFCIDELQWRASHFKESGLAVVLGLGHADIVKQDTIPQEFRERFAAAARELEIGPADWHPGSEETVRDLVHPSLYAFQYGQSCVLADCISLENADAYTGSGTRLDFFKQAEEGSMLPYHPYNYFRSTGHHWEPYEQKYELAFQDYSRRFQWLPAEYQDGKFTSYINNLPYPKCRDLYNQLAKLVEYSIPVWEHCMAVTRGDKVSPINVGRHPVMDEDDLWSKPEEASAPEPPALFFWQGQSWGFPSERAEYATSTMREWSEKNDAAQLLEAWRDRWTNLMRLPAWPEIQSFAEWSPTSPEKQFDLTAEDLQIIVKLANIELTPEKPRYEGGSWHVEGLANEHICATTIFYYASENITESAIAFRSGGMMPEDEPNYPQDEFRGLERIYGTELRNDEATVPLGRIRTPQGRLLGFPNVFQHKVQPFELEDRSKPGHRKVAVLWLVNPQKRVISTAHVPPQQRASRESTVRSTAGTQFPPEIVNMIADCAFDHLPTAAEAQQHRRELMAERAIPAKNYAEIEATYSFCEH